jgi:hypothetical protein
LETKRFIGNDMPRIYARVKKEFGPDAVIVRTRSLLREGAEPLIEVLAGLPEGEAEVAFDLQRALIDGVLGRVQEPIRAVTIGDLEDLVARDQDPAWQEPAAAVYAEAPPAHDWLQGFVGDAPAAPTFAMAPAEDAEERAQSVPRRFPSLPTIPLEPAPLADWAARPRPTIVTRTRRAESPVEEPAALHHLGPRHEEPWSPAPELLVAGFSERAARLIETASGVAADTAHALGALLEGRQVRYPEEHRTAIISIQGPAGAGRTTALMRMALDCADSGRAAMLLAADGSHVAGRQQVHAYAEAIGLTAIDAFDPGDIVRAAGQAARGTCLFIDAPAGEWKAPPMPGVHHYQYLALPSHWQSGALEAAARAFSLGSFSGAVLTFTDLATTLSPVLSVVVESPLGVAFLSSSRDVGTGIDIADPLALASGIFTTRTRESTNGRLVATA